MSKIRFFEKILDLSLGANHQLSNRTPYTQKASLVILNRSRKYVEKIFCQRWTLDSILRISTRCLHDTWIVLPVLVNTFGRKDMGELIQTTPLFCSSLKAMQCKGTHLTSLCSGKTIHIHGNITSWARGRQRRTQREKEPTQCYKKT